MAKIKWGMYVTDGRGKQGGHVLSKNRSGAYVRTKVTPTNPQTSFQSNVRGIFAAITTLWSTLTAASRLSFDNLVTSYATTDVFGDLRNPTGKALFQKLNQNLVNSGQTQITICPPPIAVPYANVASAIADISTTTFDVSFDGDSTGSKLLILATPPLSQGTTFVKNKLRQIVVADGDAEPTIDIYAAYVARFGTLTAGANIYIAVKTVNSQGQASPAETLKALVQA